MKSDEIIFSVVCFVRNSPHSFHTAHVIFPEMFVDCFVGARLAVVFCLSYLGFLRIDLMWRGVRYVNALFIHCDFHFTFITTKYHQISPAIIFSATNVFIDLAER